MPIISAVFFMGRFIPCGPRLETASPELVAQSQVKKVQPPTTAYPTAPRNSGEPNVSAFDWARKHWPYSESSGFTRLRRPPQKFLPFKRRSKPSRESRGNLAETVDKTSRASTFRVSLES